MDEKPLQEQTSTYFNDILNKSQVPLTVDQLPEGTLEKFNEIVDRGFGDDAENVKRRIRYIIPYILQSVDWESYGIPLDSWQLKYYYQRERFLKRTHLNFEEFMAHEYLQSAIEELKLEPEPTFEFILFLKYYLDLRAELRYSSPEQFERLKKSLDEGVGNVRMEVVVSGRHFKFSNEEFVRELIKSVDVEKLNIRKFKDEFSEGESRDKIRALDYYLVKTLLDYLPIKVERRRGQYTQGERNLGLSILNYLGRISGEEPEFLCGSYNNATFDKLMRDFRNARIPFVMELFL